MKVMKFGGGCLRDGDDFKRIAGILRYQPFGQVVLVVSAVHDITDYLDSAIDKARESERSIPHSMQHIRQIHESIISDAIQDDKVREDTLQEISERLQTLERLLYGISYTGEITETVRILALSQGERLSSIILSAVLNTHGKTSQAFESDKIGIVTDTVCDNATANLPQVKHNLQEKILPLMRRGVIPVITGFFGCTEKGKITSFGRNGSDYSASVVAYALDARELYIWKDVDGFMTADPKIIQESKHLESLSYYEAAELSYFGARILHPRTVEPLVGTNTRIYIRNIHAKESVTLVEQKGIEEEHVIKSVTFNDRISILRIHGAGVGQKPGIIGEIGQSLAYASINIFSVLTSQTCINLLLDNSDAAKGIDALRHHVGGVIERIEIRNDIALIAVVGEGLLTRDGLAARVFSAVAAKSINVEMFAAGASDVAYYFVVAKSDLQSAISAVHNEFFGT